MAPNPAPFISLCMIVKDEERFIEQCLDSALPLVDEVVIYDTGSTDRTIELAEAKGATVLRGHWDDDFSRARNEALAACRGTWILWLDADEVIEADRNRLRDALRRSPAIDCVRVPIENVGAQGGDFAHVAVRLFRRTRMHWVGQLHEHVERNDGREPKKAQLEHARIRHYGYSAEVNAERDKIDRNLRIALDALDRTDGEDDLAIRLINVARSYSMAGRRDEAADHFARARDVAEGTNQTFAIRLGAEVLLDSARYDEAAEWIDAYAAAEHAPVLLTFLQGSLDLFRDGDGAVLADVDPETAVTDRFGITISQDVVRRRVAQALVAEERWHEAADLLADAVLADPRSSLWPPAVLATARAGRDMDALVALLPAEDLRMLIGQFIVLDADARDCFAEALTRRFPMSDPNVAAFVAAHAARLDTVEQMLPWATLIRSATYDLPCPVMQRAKDPTATPTERWLAGVSAHAAFGDRDALPLLFEISDLLRPEDEGDAAYILSEIAPDLIVS